MSSVRVLRCTCLEVLARFSASQVPCAPFDGVRSATLLTFPMSERKVHFSVSYPLLSRPTFLTAWTMKLTYPNTVGSLRYRSMPSGGRIALDGSSGCLRSPSKFLAGMETYMS